MMTASEIVKTTLARFRRARKSKAEMDAAGEALERMFEGSQWPVGSIVEYEPDRVTENRLFRAGIDGLRYGAAVERHAFGEGPRPDAGGAAGAYVIHIEPDGTVSQLLTCDCTVADRCPQGRRGVEPRCSIWKRQQTVGGCINGPL